MHNNLRLFLVELNHANWVVLLHFDQAHLDHL